MNSPREVGDKLGSMVHGCCIQSTLCLLPRVVLGVLLYQRGAGSRTLVLMKLSFSLANPSTSSIAVFTLIFVYRAPHLR